MAERAPSPGGECPTRLTHAQKLQLFEHGYAVLPGVVPPAMVAAALRAINHSLGEEGMDKAALPTMRAQTYCRELVSRPVVTDLFNRTPAAALAESLLGAGKLVEPGGGQIALRFPSLADPAPPGGAHLDGLYTPSNGVPAGTVQHFTLLAAVFLSDTPEPDSGNFTVWPGTHRRFGAYFREHGPRAILAGMPPLPAGETPAPVQVRARAGDVVLAHYLLAHSVAANASPHIRYAVFFRLYHADHEALGWDVLADPWREWEGMHAVASGAPTPVA